MGTQWVEFFFEYSLEQNGYTSYFNGGEETAAFQQHQFLHLVLSKC
jgi:hypothetical protein